jgi:hypothetical protein
MRSDSQNVQIERLARALAASAGVVWEHLDHYPGYLRGMWRSQAASLIGAQAQAYRPFA